MLSDFHFCSWYDTYIYSEMTLFIGTSWFWSHQIKLRRTLVVKELGQLAWEINNWKKLCTASSGNRPQILNCRGTVRDYIVWPFLICSCHVFAMHVIYGFLSWLGFIISFVMCNLHAMPFYFFYLGIWKGSHDRCDSLHF